MRFVCALPVLLAALWCAPATKANEAGARIALTFDDLPAHGPLPPAETRLSIAASIIATLKAHHVVQAYGFVSGSFGSDDPLAPAVLKAWRQAGYPLGNHSWSHWNLDTITAEAYLQDVTRNEAMIAPLMRRRDWHWFRYPYLAEGADPAKRGTVRAGLTARGYRVADVTLSFDDYAFNEPYARCLARHDQQGVADLERLYLEGARADLAGAGGNGGQVLLLHIGAFTAHMLPRLLANYEQSGAHFVTLNAALRAHSSQVNGDANRGHARNSLSAISRICAIPTQMEP